MPWWCSQERGDPRGWAGAVLHPLPGGCGQPGAHTSPQQSGLYSFSSGEGKLSVLRVFLQDPDYAFEGSGIFIFIFYPNPTL